MQISQRERSFFDSFVKFCQSVYRGGHVQHHQIQQRDSGHSLNNYAGPGGDERIVAPVNGHRTDGSVGAERSLFSGNGRCGLEADPDANIAAIADSAQDAAGMIGALHSSSAGIGLIFIIVFMTHTGGDLRAVSDLHSLNGADREEGMSQQSVELVKDRLSDSGRHGGYDAGYGPAGGSLLCDALLKPCRSLLFGDRIRHAQRT